MGVEECQQLGSCGIASHQYGHVLLGHPQFLQFAYLLCHLLHRTLFIVVTVSLSVFLEEGDVHVTFRSAISGTSLCHIAIDIGQTEPGISGLAVQYVCCLCEEGIVEVHHRGATSPVPLQSGLLGLKMPELLVCSLENLPVTSPPSVYALLHVAHQQTVSSAGQVLYQQITKVGPLHPAGILELIYHDMVELCASSLQDEGCITAFHHLAEQDRRAAEQELSVLRTNIGGLLLNCLHQTEWG